MSFSQLGAQVMWCLFTQHFDNAPQDALVLRVIEPLRFCEAYQFQYPRVIEGKFGYPSRIVPINFHQQLPQSLGQEWINRRLNCLNRFEFTSHEIPCPGGGNDLVRKL